MAATIALIPAIRAYAGDPRHYTYYNPNPTFAGGWAGLTQTTSGGTKTLTLERTVVWSYDAGAGARIRSAVRLPGGNTLLADYDGRRVFEVSGSGDFVWSYDATDDPTLEGPAGATVTDADTVLIADPAGKQVLEVARDKSVVWRYSTDDDPGLEGPTTARLLPENGNVIITDTAGGRVIEVTKDKDIVWESDVSERPRDARRLGSGQTLITDESGHRVCSVGSGSDVVWQFGITGESGSDGAHLDSPTSAERLADGSTLIADTGNGRVVRVSSAGKIVDVYGSGGSSDSDAEIDPEGGANSTTAGLLIVDTGGNRILEVGYATSGSYETGELNFGMPGVNKWITDILPDTDVPDGTTLKVYYSLNGGAWKRAGSGRDFEIASPGPSGYAKFRVDFAASDRGVTPSLSRLDVKFYLAKPPVYKPKKKDDDTGGSGGGSSGGSGGSGSGSGGGVSVGTGTGTGTGSGSGPIWGNGTGTGGGVAALGNAPGVVAENVPVSELGGMLSGWVLDEKTVGSEGTGGGGGGALTDPAGLVAAALVLSFAYAAGISYTAYGGLLLGALRPLRALVTRSIHG